MPSLSPAALAAKYSLSLTGKQKSQGYSDKTQQQSSKSPSRQYEALGGSIGTTKLGVEVSSASVVDAAITPSRSHVLDPELAEEVDSTPNVALSISDLETSPSQGKDKEKSPQPDADDWMKDLDIDMDNLDDITDKEISAIANAEDTDDEIDDIEGFLASLS